MRIIQRVSRSQIWEFSLVFAGQAVTMALGMAGIKLLTSRMTPASYGELSLAITVSTLPLQVLFTPLSQGMLRYHAQLVAAGAEHSALSFIHSTIHQLIRTRLVPFVLLLSPLLAFAWGWPWWYLTAVAGLFGLLQGIIVCLEAIQHASRRRALVIFHQVAFQILRFGAAVACLASLRDSPSAAMIGFTIAATLVALSHHCWLARHSGRPSVCPNPTQMSWLGVQIKEYSAPFSLWALFTAIQTASDRWALSLLFSTADVGLYAAIFQIGFTPIQLVTNSFTQYISPILFGAGEARKNPGHITIVLAQIALGLTFAGTCVTYFIAPWIFGFLTAKEYVTVAGLLPIMVASGGLFACGQTLSLFFLVHHDPRSLLSPKLVGAIIGTVLNFLLTYLAGLAGTVLAVFLFSLLYFSWLRLRVTRYERAMRNTSGSTGLGDALTAL